MAQVQDALRELGITNYVMRGVPTNEAEFNSMFRKATVDENGNAVEDPSIPFGVTWSQVSEKLTELQAAEPLKKLRKERNRKLAQTDWWASSDLTMTAEQTAYRQALRDITDTYSSLDTVVWPTKP